MNYSLHIGRYAGIPVKIHWTFGIMILFIAGYGISNGVVGMDLVRFMALVFTLYFCVILHEYGHALSARRYNVATIDIIISPIGGLARLEKLPEKPLHEMIVAIAGPLVNVAIVLVLGVGLWIAHSGDMSIFTSADILDKTSEVTFSDYVVAVIGLNLVLFLFNLIPAFPMDGGRILRALLSIKLGRARGTYIASIIGRVLAVIFIILGILMSQYMWAFVGYFVFMMARKEYKNVAIEEALKATYVHQLYSQKFSTCHYSTIIKDAREIYSLDKNRYTIIVNEDQSPVGILSDKILMKYINDGNNLHETVERIMSNTVILTSLNSNLKTVVDNMREKETNVAIVLENDSLALAGIIDYTLIKQKKTT